MSPKKIRILVCGAIALQLATLAAGSAYGDIIILADPDARTLPIVINPAMRGIIFTTPPKDNPSLVRRQISRAHNWAAYKGNEGNAPMAGSYYPYVYDPNDTPEIRTRATVDYSLGRAHSYRR